LAMPNVEPNRLAVTTLVRLIDEGELTAEAVVESCLERIAAREPVVRAWSHLAAEAALAKARERDRTGKKTLLNGVPFGLKDIFDSADMPTTYGSPIYVGCRPANDASAATLPRAAGGILLGKTVSTEFANAHPGATMNPHNPGFSPGGSSSGSAAAVADFMVPLAIGTQTGGSVIRPAAYCGVGGFKPSFGLFPPAGLRIHTATLHTAAIPTPAPGRHQGAVGGQCRPVRWGVDGDPLYAAGDAGARAPPRSVPRTALGRRAARRPRRAGSSRRPPRGSRCKDPRDRIAAQMRRR